MTGKKEEKLVKALEKLLADTYTLYLKTHNYHWNVTGQQFSSLHIMFQTQYEELALAVDEVAERIRTIGYKAPGSYAAFLKLTVIKEETGSPKAMQMLKNLTKDHETLSESAERVIQEAQKLGDEPSTDIGIRRKEIHQKTHWMLTSHLE